MTMTAREIQFVRKRLECGGDVSDVDIERSLGNSHYAARVRFSIAVEDFMVAMKSQYSRIATLIARRS